MKYTDEINNQILFKRATLLCIGPMSKNCIDSAIELSNEYNVPIVLIASRRQINSKDFRGGYVNNWTTREFSRYVLEKDKRGKIILARDHGGPWQNSLEQEKNLSLKHAMASAKLSLREDIDSGFQILHLDPSIDIHYNPSLSDILNRLYELYGALHGYNSPGDSGHTASKKMLGNDI